ncbi:maleate cis-trans isomerase family protein [Shimia sediminis]|uniref:maleate cis-trans isomerase family protein n=1 Tax=Shimia sediminis TaxID=2497945 RepID=UPI000F8CCFED|nr:aspartate/glutamate racemase family protein [Shimia sediminis]
MTTLPYTLDQDDPAIPPIGLVALQTDETIEPEFSRYFRDYEGPLYVTRVPSGEDVTTETLAAMEANLPAAAALLPAARAFRVVGYGCTSGSSVIGSETVEAMVKRTCNTEHVTDPLRATVACAGARGVSRFALLSPYIEEVNATLRAAFARQGVSMEVFGTFGVREEAKVVRLSQASIIEAAVTLGRDSAVEAVFLSCTNLRTIDALHEIEKEIGKPVMSSNQALAWHMRRFVEQNQERTF